VCGACCRGGDASRPDRRQGFHGIKALEKCAKNQPAFPGQDRALNMWCTAP
jgi:hypothetical protein